MPLAAEILISNDTHLVQLIPRSEKVESVY